MEKSNLEKVNERIVACIVSGCKKIENGVFDGFTKMTDKFVDQFMEKEDESEENANKRTAGRQARTGMRADISKARKPVRKLQGLV